MFSDLIPELRAPARDLVAAAGAAGLQPRVTSTTRSYAQQKRLYDRYLAGMSPYPAAPPGHSAHEYGWAFDMIVSPLDALADVGAYWEQQGGVWGGRIGDDVHFEYPGFKEALGSDISTAATLDNATAPGITLNDVKDFVSTLPYSFTTDIVLSLADSFAPNEIVTMLLHPSKAVEKYPWLRLLGPPFVFY